MAPTAFNEPNHYQVSGKHLHVSYATTGIDGKPKFTYQDLHQTLSFSGEEIRSVQTDVGTSVSVTIRLTVDTGGTTFTLLIPRVSIPGEQSVPIQTIGITTVHKFSVIPIIGQRDLYHTTHLTGNAARIRF